MRYRFGFYVRYAFSLCCIFLLYQTYQLRKFERHLTSSSITFAHFSPDYATALIDSNGNNSKLTCTWPSHPSIPAAEEQDTIPPIIHFIWFPPPHSSHLDISTIPISGSHAPSLCHKFNPSFTIQTWNVSQTHVLLSTHYPWFLPTYNAYAHPIQRVDATKHFILHHHGGIYMDLDISCRRALDPLLHFPAWLPKAAPLGVNNDLLAARARHPLLRYMTDHLRARDRNLLFPYATIFYSTGPKFASDMLRQWLGRQGRRSKRDAVFVLPPEFYSEQHTFFGHSPGGTWHGWDVAGVLWIVGHGRVLLLVGAVGIAVILFAVLLRRRRRTWSKLDAEKVDYCDGIEERGRG